jgi:phage terminase small subunit
LFVEHYLQSYNATQAAIAAGYSERSAYSTGWETLRKPEVAEAIRQRLQATAMSADEVLMRISDQARGDMGDYLQIADDGTPQWDFKAMQQARKLHHIKKLKTRTRKTVVPGDEDEPPTEVTETLVEVELYDAYAAKALLAKHHGLVSDKLDVTHREVPNLSADELAQAEQELQAWLATRKNGANTSNG